MLDLQQLALDIVLSGLGGIRAEETEPEPQEGTVNERNNTTTN